MMLQTIMLAFMLTSAAVFSAPPANLSLIKSSSFAIPANVSWTETVYTEPDQYVLIHATGKWRYDPRPQFETGPDGLSNVFTTFKPGMLQGKFGDGDIIPIGSSWEGYATNKGRLMLGIYEPDKPAYANYMNNIGSLNVTIYVYGEIPSTDVVVENGQDSWQQQQNGAIIPEINGTEAQSPSSIERTCIASIVLLLSALISLALLSKYDMKGAK